MNDAVQILSPLGVVVDSVERPGLGHGIDQMVSMLNQIFGITFHRLISASCL